MEKKRNEHEKNCIKLISQKDKIKTLFIEEIYKSSRKLNKNQTLILDFQEKFEDVSMKVSDEDISNLKGWAVAKDLKKIN
jgi:hypothetical protein